MGDVKTIDTTIYTAAFSSDGMGVEMEDCAWLQDRSYLSCMAFAGNMVFVVKVDEQERIERHMEKAALYLVGHVQRRVFNEDPRGNAAHPLHTLRQQCSSFYDPSCIAIAPAFTHAGQQHSGMYSIWMRKSQ